VPNANCLGGTGSEDFRLETHWYCPPPFLGPFLVEAFSAMTVVSGPLRFLVHSVNQVRGRAASVPPEKKMTGNTGMMHGEMPVSSPPMNPTRSSPMSEVSRSLLSDAKQSAVRMPTPGGTRFVVAGL
jgi:hypothetical protein